MANQEQYNRTQALDLLVEDGNKTYEQANVALEKLAKKKGINLNNGGTVTLDDIVTIDEVIGETNSQTQSLLNGSGDGSSTVGGEMVYQSPGEADLALGNSISAALARRGVDVPPELVMAMVPDKFQLYRELFGFINQTAFESAVQEQETQLEGNLKLYGQAIKNSLNAFRQTFNPELKAGMVEHLAPASKSLTPRTQMTSAEALEKFKALNPQK
ncbi:MAG: hypothetical protein F6K50_02895 [Moorea sp. SIO3I7]|uniref:hypothetical protein n=1 Tax=Moorena sp. SIO3I8 TaxID=2607833 RepID=UPI0013BFE246|nr:hypothetical protein [Moorena sp. SIO3I8]NEN94510.1 hypothetical protein [Moorena sp. SIO3I7]NEO09274.1 hypothetical protein [Moorena sp. SIO3I8]